MINFIDAGFIITSKFNQFIDNKPMRTKLLILKTNETYSDFKRLN